jgi:hypothetical protein
VTSYNVIGEFAAGSVGNVVFRRRVWLNDNGTLVPPQEVTATLAGSPPGFTQTLRATTETGVSPEGWTYEVFINLDGHEQLVGSMFLTDHSDLADVFQWEDVASPEFYATKGELSAFQVALGNPASQADLDTEEAARIAADSALDTRLDTAESDLDTLDLALDVETAARIAADTALDGRLDTEEAATIALDARLDTAEAELATIPTAVGATDGKMLQVASNTYVLVDEPSGGTGRVINSDSDPGDTIYIGITEPTDPPFDLEVGDLWIDTTPA